MSQRTIGSIARRFRYQVNAGAFTAAFIVCLASIVVAPWIYGAAEIQFAVFGTFLQLIGIMTVAIGIRRTRQDLGGTGLFRQVMQFASYPRPIEGSVNFVEGPDLWSAIGHVSNAEPRDGAPISEVVVWVKQQIDLVDKNLKAKDEAQTKRLDTVNDQLTAETNSRVEVAQQVERLRRLTTGGLNLSAYGVACLLVGVVYGTLPADLHHLAVLNIGAR
jgi:hypothetical protein